MSGFRAGFEGAYGQVWPGTGAVIGMVLGQMIKGALMGIGAGLAWRLMGWM